MAAKVAKSRILYLSFDIFHAEICREDEVFQERLLSHLLYGHAVNNRRNYVRKSGGLLSDVMEFLARERKLEASSQALFVDFNLSSCRRHSQRFQG